MLTCSKEYHFKRLVSDVAMVQGNVSPNNKLAFVASLQIYF